MSTKIASGFVKFPVLPVAYMAAGPLIGFYRGLRNKNTPLNYGRLVSKYPRDGYVAESWLDWLNGPDDDKPSVFGAMFSTWLGSVTSVIPWLLVVGAALHQNAHLGANCDSGAGVLVQGGGGAHGEV